MKMTLVRVAEAPDTVTGVACERAPKVHQTAGHAGPAPEPCARVQHDGPTPSNRPARVMSERPIRPATGPMPLRSPRGMPAPGRKAIWDKDNVGFWLSACIAMSLLFSIVYSALG